LRHILIQVTLFLGRQDVQPVFSMRIGQHTLAKKFLLGEGSEKRGGMDVVRRGGQRRIGGLMARRRIRVWFIRKRAPLVR
jgi:hypothetical protein